MKIAMDSSVLDMFERMLDPNDRQSRVLPPNLRYPSFVQEAFDNIDALEKISQSGARFCLLPSNIEELQRIRRPRVESYLGKCCENELDEQNINRRKNALIDPHEHLEEECKLLAEAEECGVNILLTTNGKFIKELGRKAKNVKIIKPIDYANEVNCL